jgi:hypothetical protein
MQYFGSMARPTPEKSSTTTSTGKHMGKPLALQICTEGKERKGSTREEIKFYVEAFVFGANPLLEGGDSDQLPSRKNCAFEKYELSDAEWLEF